MKKIFEIVLNFSKNNTTFLIFTALIIFGSSGVVLNYNVQKNEAQKLIQYIDKNIIEIEQSFTNLSVNTQNLSFDEENYKKVISELKKFNESILKIERETPVKTYNKEFVDLGDSFRNFILQIHFETILPMISRFEKQLELINEYRQYGNLKRSVTMRDKLEIDRSLKSYEIIVDSEIELAQNFKNEELKKIRMDELAKIKDLIMESKESIKIAENTISEGQKTNLENSIGKYFPPEKVAFPQLSFNMLATGQYQESVLYIDDYINALRSRYQLD